MPPAKPNQEGSKALIGVMVLFIVLFLIAAVFAIMQYTKNEQVVKDRQEAEERLAVLASNSEYNRLRGLAVDGKTVMARVNRLVSDTVAMIDGEEAGKIEPAGAWKAIEDRVDPLWEQAEVVLRDAEGIREAGLASLVESLVAEVAYWQEAAGDAEVELAKATDEFDATVARQEANVAELNAQLDAASRSGQTYKDQYNQLAQEQAQKYENIISGLNSQIGEARDQQKQAQDDAAQMQRDLAAFEIEVGKLRQRLTQFQPKPDTEAAAVEKDGHIVQVVARDNIAYIDLSKDDQIYRGLTFTAYDSFRPFLRDSKGKGTLEVIEIGDNISKCRITKSDATNPIMDGDIIANLVWSVDKDFLFCVVGDFDFDRDGSVDMDGRDRIVGLVEAWGGQATDRVTVDTDFLVVGKTPVVPERPVDEYGAAGTLALQEYEEAYQRADTYAEVRDTGAALGVPTFNQARFFDFIGY